MEFCEIVIWIDSKRQQGKLKKCRYFFGELDNSMNKSLLLSFKKTMEKQYHVNDRVT